MILMSAGDNWGGFRHRHTEAKIFRYFLEKFLYTYDILTLNFYQQEEALYFISNFISKLYTWNYTLIQLQAF